MTPRDASPVDWVISSTPVDYPDAVRVMEARVADILAGRAAEAVWLLEHPSLYTAGPSAKAADLLEGPRLPVFPSGRGGQYTYHGPGQRVVYVMLDLRRRRPDVRAYVRALEEWIIRVLADFGVAGLRREGRTGVWVAREGGREDKIAAIGVRLRRWVGFHGFAINLNPDLAYFNGIVPCGIADARFGVTSLADLQIAATMTELDAALARHFTGLFQSPVFPASRIA